MPKKAENSDNKPERHSLTKQLLEFQKDILEDVDIVLKRGDHPLWMLLPSFSHAVGELQRDVAEQIRERPYGKTIAPLLETSVDIQARLLEKVIDSRGEMIDASAKLVDRYHKSVVALLNKPDE